MASINCRTRDGRKVWIVQVRLKGLKSVSRQFDDKRAAQAWAKEEEERLGKLRQVAGVSPEVGTVLIRDLIDRYLKDPKAKALATYAERQRQLTHWRQHYGVMRCREFGPQQILERRDALLESGLAPASVNRYVAAMRRAWNWGRNVRLLDHNVAWPGEIMLDEDNTRARFLTDAELAAVLEAAKAHSLTMHAAIVVSLATGLRQSELLRLEWRDVNYADEALTIRKTKNDTPRSVHLPAVAAQGLKSLKKESTVLGRFVFLDEHGEHLTNWQLDGRWDTIRDKAKLADFRWHDLRHSCASYLAQNGASLLEIASVLGHKSLQATQRYAHLVPGKQVTGHGKLDEKLKGAS